MLSIHRYKHTQRNFVGSRGNFGKDKGTSKPEPFSSQSSLAKGLALFNPGAYSSRGQYTLQLLVSHEKRGCEIPCCKHMPPAKSRT